MDPKTKISVAVTHYNRFPMLVECLAPIIKDERVGEIIISDDASTDGSFNKLLDFYEDARKVKVYRNKENVDCYANKASAIRHVDLNFRWTVLFDSDNILTPEYLDVLYMIPEWDPAVAYCPSFAKPHFDYRSLQGIMFSRKNVAQYAGSKTFFTALNTCNYFVHRDSYLDVWDGSVNPHTADSIYQNYNWLKSGRKLVIVKGLHYFHRVHAESHYKLNVKKTGHFAKEVEQKLRALR